MYTEICAISKISKKEIGRCFKLILKALETSVDLITSGDFMVWYVIWFLLKITPIYNSYKLILALFYLNSVVCQ